MLKGSRSIQAQGCGGQSFGAFLPKGQEITLYGVANDYIGKGLSGGIAWVLDEDGTLKRHVNNGLVNISPVHDENEEELYQLLKMHADHTNSRKAMSILNNFKEFLPKFRTVVSEEYLKYLKKNSQKK